MREREGVGVLGCHFGFLGFFGYINGLEIGEGIVWLVSFLCGSFLLEPRGSW